MGDATDALNSDLAQTTWDAIVIGAGPAGALAARQAALAGLKTLLIDAKSFPREKVCGGYLNNRALQVLRQTLLTQLAVDRPESHVRELELVCGRQRVRFPLPPGRVVDRATFDARLLKSATIAGATILTKTQAVVEPTVCDASRCVTVIRNGRRETLHARVVVCADGLSRTSVRQLPEFAVSTSPDSRVGIGAVVAGNVDEHPVGQITMVASHHGYVGISRFSRHQLNVAAAVAPALLSQTAPAEIVANIFDNAGISAPRALHGASWRGTPPLTSQPLHVASERIFLIGDAGGYVEPFTGEGMAAALESAVAVTPLVIQASNAWVPSIAVGWEALHQQIVRDRQVTCRQLAWILRRPWAAFAALSTCRVLPGVAQRLIAKTTFPSTLCMSPGVGTT